MGSIFSSATRAAASLRSRHPIASRALQYWIAVEFVFYVYFRMKLRNLQPYTSPPPLLPSDQARAMIRKVWQTLSVHAPGDGVGLRDFISGWFYGAPFERLRRGNVEEFLAWALWSRFPHGLSAAERAELDFIVTRIEQRSGLILPPGKDHSLQCMRLSIDPCRASHRPLLVYIGLYWVSCVAKWWLQYRGFTLFELGTLRYWYRAPTVERISLVESNDSGEVSVKPTSILWLATSSALRWLIGSPVPSSESPVSSSTTKAQTQTQLEQASDHMSSNRPILSSPSSRCTSYWCGHDELDAHAASCRIATHSSCRTLDEYHSRTYSLDDFVRGVPLPVSTDPSSLVRFDAPSNATISSTDIEACTAIGSQHSESTLHSQWPSQESSSELLTFIDGSSSGASSAFALPNTRAESSRISSSTMFQTPGSASSPLWGAPTPTLLTLPSSSPCQCFSAADGSQCSSCKLISPFSPTVAWANRTTQTAILPEVDSAVDEHSTTNDESSPNRKPIIFLHGVGVGLLGYLPLIREIELRAADRPLFLVEMPYVAMRLWEHIPTPFETAELIHAMLAQHSFSRAAFVGHSFGSISVAWVRKLRPQIVDSIVLLDPVCLLLNFAKTAFNFVYKSPRATPGDGFSLMDWIVSFCSTELSMARTMHRHFWWYLNSLWAEELPANTTIVLSAEDSLVPSCRVRRHLELHAPNAQVHWLSGLNHAHFLMHPNVTARIAELIARRTA